MFHIDLSYDVKAKTDKAVALLRHFEPAALEMSPKEYYLAYSGGKDSDVLLHLVLTAGVKFAAHYNVTGIGHTAVVKHIKNTRNKLNTMGIELYMETPNKFTTGEFKGKTKNMFRLIMHFKTLPSMRTRFCCRDLKERGGQGYMCLTGVRWAESTARKLNRMPLEIRTNGDRILLNDNEDNRR